MVFITGTFASSIICLIWQNMVRTKQKVQTNHDMLTRKPAGYEGPIRPGKTLEFLKLCLSSFQRHNRHAGFGPLNLAATRGAQFWKALLNSAPYMAQIFKSMWYQLYRALLKIQPSNLVPKWGLNSVETNHSKLITLLQACYCLTVVIRCRRKMKPWGRKILSKTISRNALLCNLVF